MKRAIAFGFALSVLTATAAMASPQTITSQSSLASAASSLRLVDRVHADGKQVRVAQTGDKSFSQSLEQGKVLVAENRREFGSQYQRY
jgi:maltoporin